jgi:hypothetical protein
MFKPALAVESSETSREAAALIEPQRVTLRARVYAFIDLHGSDGATDEEIQEALGMNPSTERPRRVELVEAGRIRDSGRTRRTKANRRAVVWVVA